MRCAAVIAEYNPFHNGHAFQIRKTKEEGGADYVIALMSPDFVQRGMPAFADKYTRTGMALEGGADLVLEMPVRTAVSSAGDFASGSVKILNALGCIDLISFGSESGDLGALTRIADLLSSETPLFKDILTSSLKEGATYAAARQRSLAALLTGKQQLSGNDPAFSCFPVNADIVVFVKSQGDGIAALFLPQSIYRRFQLILLLPFFLLLIAAHQIEQADLLRFLLC